MNVERSTEDRIRSWLLETAPGELPDRVLDETFFQTRPMPQTSGRRPWRKLSMRPPNLLIATGAGAILVAVVALGGGLLSRPAVSGPGTTAPPSSRPSATPSSPPSAVVAAGVSTPGTIVFLQHDPDADTDQAFAMSSDGTGRRALGASSVCCLTLAADGRAALMAVDQAGLVTPVFVGIGADGFGEGPETVDMNLAPWTTHDLDLAFEGWDDAQPNRNGVWLSIDNGGGMAWGDLRQLTTNPDGRHDLPIAFSPDGTHLLFLREQGDTGGDLYVIGIDGKDLRRLSPAGRFVRQDGFLGSGASWSPDGTKIAFAAADAANTAPISVYDMETGAIRTITAPGTWTTSVAWSPDGDWIAFDRASGIRHDLILVDPVDGTQAELTNRFDPGVCCGIWSPDSRYVLVKGTPSDDEHYDLYAIAADGSGATQLTHDPGFYTSFGWTSVIDR